jgi:transposase
MATCKGRRTADVIAWFHSRPQDERDLVEVVVLDRSKACFAAVKEVCSARGQGIDRVHVGQQAVAALDGVLRSVHKRRGPEDAKDLKKLRQRWLQSANQRAVDELSARYAWRRRCPELRATIDGGQDLRRGFERQYDKPARAALLQLMERAGQSVPEPLQRIAGTLTRWFNPIVRYIRNRYTNGRTEGFNNKSKLIQRMAYGLRNAHNRRKRILAYCGRT